MTGFFRTRMQDALATAQPISGQDRSHAAATHLLGAIVGVFTAGFLAPVLATTLVLVFNSTRNPFVLFHVNQAAWYQVCVSAIAGVSVLLFVLLYFVTCGVAILLLPLALIPWSLSVLLPLWLALRAYQGEWAGYPFIGDYVLDQETPFVDG